MTVQSLPQLPLLLTGATKREVRSQFAALCYRKESGKTRILLVTSRDSGRWITPKGWPEADETPAGSALKEAYEEAGVKGRVHPMCLGIYSYSKTMPDGPALPCVVALYAVRVKRLLRKYPERSERSRKWFTPKRAAQMVREPELREMIKNFDARAFRGGFE